MNIKPELYLEWNDKGKGPYLNIIVSLDNNEANDADFVNEIAKKVTDYVVGIFPPAELVKEIITAIYGDLRPTINSKNMGFGVKIETHIPCGGVGVPWSAVEGLLGPPNFIDPSRPLLLQFWVDKEYLGLGPWNIYFNIPYVSDDLNDKISSLKLCNGAVAILWEHSDYQGCGLLIENDISYIGDFYNDKISSIQVFKSINEVRGLNAYEDAFFKGNSFFFNSNSGYVGKTLNDKFDSIKLYNINKAFLFDDAGFKGKSLEIWSDIDELGKFGLHDKVSSLKIDY